MSEQAVERYLRLLRGCLTRDLFLDEEWWDADLSGWTGPGSPDEVRAALRSLGWRAHRRGDPTDRLTGRDWPPAAETMVGSTRLDNVEWVCRTALDEGIPGDFAECGVWRGGTAILMKGVLAALGDGERVVWAADSFEGLPSPDADRYPEDAGQEIWSTLDVLKVDLDTVRANFARYDLLDDRVRFLKGWFSDTLADSPIERLSVLRLDGDLYQSTMESLVALEPRVSPGGFVLVDDYGGWPSCRAAVDEYRADSGIDAPIQTVDWTGVWWRKLD